jgi:hypothetical protein
MEDTMMDNDDSRDRTLLLSVPVFMEHNVAQPGFETTFAQVSLHVGGSHYEDGTFVLLTTKVRDGNHKGDVMEIRLDEEQVDALRRLLLARKAWFTARAS